MKEAFVSETTVTPAASPQQQSIRQTSAFRALASDRPFFQTKLRVGSPNDPLEKEADDMAARVVQKPENSFVQRKCATCEEKEKVQRKSLADGVTPFVQRKVDVGRTLQRKENEEEEPVQTKLIQRKGEEEEEPVKAKFLSEGGFSISAIDGPLQDSKGKGSRLSGSVLRDMEAGFGIDLGEVRIHTDQAAVEMNQSVQAQAFTHGWDIYFNQHRFDPGTNEGKFLLAHELTHTIQQAKAKGETLKPALSRAEPEKPAVADEAQAIESAKLQSLEEAAELTANSQLPPKESSIEKNLPKSLPKKAESKQSPTLPACKPPAKKKGDTVELAKPHAEATDTKNQSASASPSTVETKPSSVAQAPKCPENDPAFKKAKSIVNKDAKKQADHEPANKKRTEMVASAALPMAEQNVQSGQEQQAANLEKAASPRPFDRFQFKEKLKLTIASKMPKTEDQAKAFSDSSKLNEAKEEFKGTISEEKEKVSGPLEHTAEQPLPPGKDLKPDNIPIPEAKPGDKPSQVPSGLATPKPRTDAEISLDHKSVELDNQMTREGLTEQQLAESEEPKFEQALQSKKDAQREIAAAPDRYRQVEGQQLEKTSNEADKKTKHELSIMSSTKGEKNRDVFGGQTAKETQTEQRQKDIKDQIDGIYNRTKTDVEKILADLSTTVEATFSREVDLANETFKANVRSRLDDHYGFFTFDDKIAEWAGLSDGVAHIFREEKELFLYNMDIVLDNIASTVETELNNALQRIQSGRTELETFKQTLSTDELKFAEDLFLEAGDKFNELESSVHESQDELIESLSDAYVENVSKLQEEFDKIDEELSASWIADAISFIGEVATAIKKLGQLLSSIASRIGQYISDILASPKRFFNNLVDGIKGGMDEFTERIDTYLEQDFWMWLTGASGGTNIQIPKKMDAEGMFSLATQILGLTKEFVLERIKTVLRIPVDAFLALVDKAKEIGGKVLEPVKILINQGIGALWVWVKDEVSGHLTEIFEKLKVEIFQAIIKKFLLWVASLFIPGLGFIKLIQAAYKALRWLVDNIDRIVEIVNTFLDAVGLAVAGNVSAIKGKVVKALTNGVVIAIDFLAKLVGLGNFSDKLQRGIEMLRKPVRKVIDMILIKAKPIVRKIQKAIAKGVAKVKSGIRKVKEKGKAAIKKIFNWWKAKKLFRDSKGESHQLYFAGKAKTARLTVASTNPRHVSKFLESIKPITPKDKLKLWNSASTLNSKIQVLQTKLESNNQQKTTKLQVNQTDYEALNGHMVALAANLTGLMSLIDVATPPPPILPAFSNSVRAISIEASFLTAGVGFPAGEDARLHKGTLGGWQELQDSETRSRDNFVKMHLLHHKMGGKATDSNLTPAKSTINSEFYNDFESKALRDSGLMGGRKKPSNKVIWYQVKLGYHGGNEYQKKFINSIVASYGYHNPDKGWAKEAAEKTWRASPGVPDLKLKIFSINEDGKTVLSKMKYQGKKFSDEFIELLVLEKKFPYGKIIKEKYSSSQDLKTRLLFRIENEKGWNKTKLTSAILSIVAALNDPKTNIKLYGSD